MSTYIGSSRRIVYVVCSVKVGRAQAGSEVVAVMKVVCSGYSGYSGGGGRSGQPVREPLLITTRGEREEKEEEGEEDLIKKKNMMNTHIKEQKFL